MFKFLKTNEVLCGGNVESIVIKEKELDVAMALCNLNERVRQGLMKDIPARAPFAPQSHIITPHLEPPSLFPRSIGMDDANFPPHLMLFHSALTSTVSQLEGQLGDDAGAVSFSTRVRARGKNLLDGGNVLQVAAQHVGGAEWWVLGIVAASMKVHRYNCYVKIISGVGVDAMVCACKGG